MNAYWHKQTTAHPLFPSLLWSRPQNRLHAGKLLIVGGNVHGFAAAAEAFANANKAGVGTARVLLPDSLRKTVGRIFEAGEYAPSTPSGSFSQKALDELLAMSAWADGVLLAGDLGRNSETAILLEKFIEKHRGQLTITKDAADYFTSSPSRLLTRDNTTMVVSLAQLQQLARSVKFTKAFTFEMDLIRLVDTLREFTNTYPINIVVKHLDTILVAANGEVSSTKLATDMPTWRVLTASQTAVWWLQNSTQTFAAITTGVYESVQP